MKTTLRLVSAALLFSAGCFAPDMPDCTYRCDKSAGNNSDCPTSYECRSDGYCHLTGSTDVGCGFPLPDLSPAPQPDLRVPPVVDLASPSDLAPADMAGVARPDGGLDMSTADLQSPPDGGAGRDLEGSSDMSPVIVVPTPDMSAAPDLLSAPADMSTVEDLAVSPDLSSPADLSAAPDMSLMSTPDMSVAVDDLASAGDLLVAPDLSTPSLDMSMPLPDLAPVEDLLSRPDSSSLPDLFPLPDMTTLPDSLPTSDQG